MSERDRAPVHAQVRVRMAVPLAILGRLPESLPETFTEQAIPRCFSSLFGDGTLLRDAVVTLLDDDHPALRSWDAFMEYLSTCEDAWYRELLNQAMLARRMRRDLPYPALIPGLNGRVDTAQFARSLIPSDDDASLIDPMTQVVQNPGDALRKLLIIVLRHAQHSPGEPDSESKVVAELKAAGRQIADRGIPGKPSLAYLTLTGGSASPDDCDRLDDCSEVHFVLVPGAGFDAPISYVGESAVVPFEPCEYPQTLAMPVDIYEALGNEMRMRIVLYLARHGEMYGAELVKLIDAPQATVSNHLAKLELAGLVRRRPRGRRTYYRLVPGTLDLAAERLTQLRLAVHAPIQRELPID